MNDTDFSDQPVLVFGGSSGTGNRTRASLDRGAKVEVWGTRAKAENYDLADECDLTSCGYDAVGVSYPNKIRSNPWAMPKKSRLQVF
jgi:3-oxoacyl-[acyl-carrier protein] reductase